MGSICSQDESTSTPSFDIAAVKANFTDECKDPIVVDDLFCQQVKIDQMTASGIDLTVPTGLNAASTARADAICDQITTAHFDGDGNDLGYQSVVILSKDGGEAATCLV